MKYPIYIATLLGISAAAAWSFPPSKSHYSMFMNKDKKERQEQKQQENQSGAQRPKTIALDVKGNAKTKTTESRSSQFQAYHHRNKGH
tara:strand:+ start:5640 stop:5903 length:264 start_codon:yes stop_codon:yes gene_type:complete